MKVQDATRETLSFWHKLAGDLVAGCNEDHLHHVAPGSTVNSVAAIYAHAVMSEDLLVQARLKGQQVLYESGAWAGRLNVPFVGDPPMQTAEWASQLRMDPATFRAYADAVHAATDAYLAALPDEELDRQTMGLFRETTVGRVITLGICAHFLVHTGEIAALQGAFGLKGLPF